MASPYDVTLRARAVTAYERGDGSYRQVSALFDPDHRTLERWVARWRETGSVVPRPRGGGWSCPIALRVLRTVVGEPPDATVAELCAAYNRAGAESDAVCHQWRASLASVAVARHV